MYLTQFKEMECIILQLQRGEQYMHTVRVIHAQTAS